MPLLGIEGSKNIFIHSILYRYIYRNVHSKHVADNFDCVGHYCCRHHLHHHLYQEKEERGETEPSKAATESNGW